MFFFCGWFLLRTSLWRLTRKMSLSRARNIRGRVSLDVTGGARGGGGFGGGRAFG